MSEYRIDPLRKLAIPYIYGIGLDIGCRDIKIVPSATGVDIDKKWKPDYRADMKNLKKIEDESQDYVFASHVLEHDPDTITVLNEFNRVLKKNGRLFVIVPHGEDVDQKTLGDSDLTHRQLFTEKTLWLYLEHCGFKVVRKQIGLRHNKRRDIFLMGEKR